MMSAGLCDGDGASSRHRTTAYCAGRRQNCWAVAVMGSGHRRRKTTQVGASDSYRKERHGDAWHLLSGSAVQGLGDIAGIAPCRCKWVGETLAVRNARGEPPRNCWALARRTRAARRLGPHMRGDSPRPTCLINGKPTDAASGCLASVAPHGLECRPGRVNLPCWGRKLAGSDELKPSRGVSRPFTPRATTIKCRAPLAGQHDR